MQIVIVGARSAADTQALLNEAARHYRPFAVHVPVEPGAAQRRCRALLPFVGRMTRETARRRRTSAATSRAGSR